MSAIAMSKFGEVFPVDEEEVMETKPVVASVSTSTSTEEKPSIFKNKKSTATAPVPEPESESDSSDSSDSSESESESSADEAPKKEKKKKDNKKKNAAASAVAASPKKPKKEEEANGSSAETPMVLDSQGSSQVPANAGVGLSTDISGMYRDRLRALVDRAKEASKGCMDHEDIRAAWNQFHNVRTLADRVLDLGVANTPKDTTLADLQIEQVEDAVKHLEKVSSAGIPPLQPMEVVEVRFDDQIRAGHLLGAILDDEQDRPRAAKRVETPLAPAPEPEAKPKEKEKKDKSKEKSKDKVFQIPELVTMDSLGFTEEQRNDPSPAGCVYKIGLVAKKHAEMVKHSNAEMEEKVKLENLEALAKTYHTFVDLLKEYIAPDNWAKVLAARARPGGKKPAGSPASSEGSAGGSAPASPAKAPPAPTAVVDVNVAALRAQPYGKATPFSGIKSEAILRFQEEMNRLVKAVLFPKEGTGSNGSGDLDRITRVAKSIADIYLKPVETFTAAPKTDFASKSKAAEQADKESTDLMEICFSCIRYDFPVLKFPRPQAPVASPTASKHKIVVESEDEDEEEKPAKKPKTSTPSEEEKKKAAKKADKKAAKKAAKKAEKKAEKKKAKKSKKEEESSSEDESD